MAEPSSRHTSDSGCSVDAGTRDGWDRAVLRRRTPDAHAREEDLRHAFELPHLREHAGGPLPLGAGPDGNGVTAVLAVLAP